MSGRFMTRTTHGAGLALFLAALVFMAAAFAASPAMAKKKADPVDIQAAPDAGPAPESETMVVTAEGLADPNSEAYQRDKGLLLDDLRRDAKAQILEKAVGSYVETSTLMENYAIVSDKVLTRSQGLIKKVIKESDPWMGEDGFAHLLMKAEVYVGELQDVLTEMSKSERVAMLKEYGNPKISVAIFIRDAARGPDIKPERSDIAENILKERIKGFGYRVWSEEQADKLLSRLEGGEAEKAALRPDAADFSIVGEAKFKAISVTLKASGLTLTKYALTSFSVKCIDNHTGEEIYFNNKVPKKTTWPDEDQAIEEVGHMIGAEFSKEFFEEHLKAPSRIYQLQVAGLPGYDVGQLLKKEFIGLRPVLNVDFREFDKNGLSLFEIEFAGPRDNFSQFLQSAVIDPLNKKVGDGAFGLESAHGDAVVISYEAKLDAKELSDKLNQNAPASVTAAAPERLKSLIKSEETLKKVAEIAPEAVKKLEEGGGVQSSSGLDAVKSF
jgi:hypothetical protein